MPYLNATTLATKVLGVAGYQDILLFALYHPDALSGVGVDNRGRVNLYFHEGPIKYVGHLRLEYATCFGLLMPLEWTITGGRPIPEIISRHGMLQQRFGLNLVLRILDLADHANDKIETALSHTVR